MWQEKNAAAERKQNMRYRRYSASSLTDSLRSVVRLRRAGQACQGMEATLSTDSGDKRKQNMCVKIRTREKAPALPVFHRLRPPDKHHRIGHSNQWWRNPTGLKDPRRFPLVAPSCALLFLPFGVPVSLRSYGRGFSFHA